jgi:osmotically-inducible protein OsmY
MDDRFGREGFGRRHEDEPRYEGRSADHEGRRYRGEGYYGGYYQPSRSRGDYGRREERGFLDRAGDEVRSWFGDEDAERRRRQDEREARQWGWRAPSRVVLGRAPDYPDYGDESHWARQWGYLERPYERAPLAEERPWADDYGRGEAWRRGERVWEDSSAWWRSRGPYTGHGPKGYQRSDERIREDVCERLTEHGDLDARNIEVRVVNREVTLEGLVASRADKRLAEDITDSVSGVGEIHNQLRVSQGVPGSDASQPTWRHRAA